ncbi:L2 [Human papillomavirus type 177]|nr:L2 [Human papillomavirus type 177]
MKAKSRSRRKRASATQLYKTCKQSGTCPPDIIPKVEGTTIADQILKYGSLGVFLGGLGIGTGSGTGGRTGYVPLGTTTAPRVPESIPLQPIRPPVTIEPVGATDSSIVSLIEETSFVNAGAPVPSLPTNPGFEVTTSTDTTPAILTVPSGDSVNITVTTFRNPTFTEPSILQTSSSIEAAGNVFTTTHGVPSQTSESIPMDTFVVSTHFNNVTSSTPIPGTRPPVRVGLYGRATQQVRVVDPAFLSSPSRLVTYDNPAYEAPQDTTLTFNHDSIHNAPDPDFLDIIALHRPALTTRKSGIRFSRLGQRATLRTRSGKQIGAKVHFYQDLSPITVPEDIPLQPIQSVSSPSSINNGLYDIYVDTSNIEDNYFPSTPSLQSPTTVAHSYTFSTMAAPGNTTVPLSTGLDVTVQPGPDISLPNSHAPTPLTPVIPIFPSGPVYVMGADFYLHPSYLFFKRKRKRLPYFLADVAV